MPRWAHSVTSLGDDSLVVTGTVYAENFSRKVEQYNVARNQWSMLPDLIQGRASHASCTFQTRFVYVFCGILQSNHQPINSIEVLDTFEDLSEGAWRSVEPLGHELCCRPHLAAVQINCYDIVVFGGENCAETCTFTASTKTVTLLPFESKVCSNQMPAVLAISKKIVGGDAQERSLFELDFTSHSVKIAHFLKN